MSDTRPWSAEPYGVPCDPLFAEIISVSENQISTFSLVVPHLISAAVDDVVRVATFHDCAGFILDGYEFNIESIGKFSTIALDVAFPEHAPKRRRGDDADAVDAAYTVHLHIGSVEYEVNCFQNSLPGSKKVRAWVDSCEAVMVYLFGGFNVMTEDGSLAKSTGLKDGRVLKTEVSVPYLGKVSFKESARVMLGVQLLGELEFVPGRTLRARDMDGNEFEVHVKVSSLCENNFTIVLEHVKDGMYNLTAAQTRNPLSRVALVISISCISDKRFAPRSVSFLVDVKSTRCAVRTREVLDPRLEDQYLSETLFPVSSVSCIPGPRSPPTTRSSGGKHLLPPPPPLPTRQKRLRKKHRMHCMEDILREARKVNARFFSPKLILPAWKVEMRGKTPTEWRLFLANKFEAFEASEEDKAQFLCWAMNEVSELNLCRRRRVERTDLFWGCMFDE